MRTMAIVFPMLIFFSLISSFNSSSQGTEQNLDTSQVYVIYSNLFVTGRTDYPMSISLTLKGSYNQTGWLVLTSPWKPLLIMSNNTDKPFIELAYNPQQVTTNPISSTSHIFAWDYDVNNNVVFIKFLTTFTVMVSIQFGVPNIIKFWPGKQIYGTSETVEVTINVYGNYTTLPSRNWIAKIVVKDMVDNIIKTIEQEFQLSQNKTKQLSFSLGIFEEGIYTAIAQIIDPRTGYALTMEQLTFEVKKLGLPTIIPPWVPWILLASAIIAIVTVNKLYRRRKRRH